MSSSNHIINLELFAKFLNEHFTQTEIEDATENPLTIKSNHHMNLSVENISKSDMLRAVKLIQCSNLNQSKIKCRECLCLNYPDCCYSTGNFCEECIDGGSGYHLKLTSEGSGIRDTPDSYEKCKECHLYFNPTKTHQCQVHTCPLCGDQTESCFCYQT